MKYIFMDSAGERRKRLIEAARMERKKRLDEIRKIINEYPEIGTPEKTGQVKRSREYESFLKETKVRPKGIYEFGCSFAEKILPMEVTGSTKESLEEDIKSSYLNVTARGVFSLSTLALIVFLFFTFAVVILTRDFMFSIVLIVLTIAGWYGLLNYPGSHAKTITMKMSADSILAILYMIIYMRSSPNLEGAVKFASENLSGPLSWDMKKLMWDIEVGTFSSADEAVSGYVDRWKRVNPEYAEALNMLRGASVGIERRNEIFDETLNVILTGTKERTKHYVSGLRMPVMLIHAMGVLLPVMGLILFPVVVIFMSNAVKPAFLFIGYDIILPIVLWLFIGYILKSQPPTFSQPDISLAKNVPKMGKFLIDGKEYSIWPLSVLVLVLLLSLAFFFPASVADNETISSVSLFSCMLSKGSEDMGKACASVSYEMVLFSMLAIFGVGASIALYCYLDSYQKTKIRSDINKIEDEFSVALFQVGNQISSGVPIETSIDKVIFNLKGMKIADMFKTISENMRKYGLTFEQSIFDKSLGAVWYYPSKLIRSIFSAVIESSKKGMEAASNAMITVSRYLKGVHDVKEDVEEILGETTASMKFLAMFLAPLVSGVTVTMAMVIISILTSLGAMWSGLALDSSQMAGGAGAFNFPLMGGMKGGMPITSPAFQLIVGIYMLETVLILGYFVNRIEHGEDAIGLRSTFVSLIIIGLVMYILSWIITYNLFGTPIGQMLGSSMTTVSTTGAGG